MGFWFTEFKAFFLASISSEFRMFVKNDAISNVARFMFSILLILLMKFDVPFRHEGNSFACD